MSIEYRTVLKSDYAQLVCHGSFSKQELIDVFDHAIDFAAENGREAVLVDISDVEGEPTTAERIELGVKAADVQLSKDTIVAVALIGNEPLIDPERLGETIALNRCAVCKVFTDMDEAISWLEHTSG
jgi:hypothetical protein